MHHSYKFLGVFQYGKENYETLSEALKEIAEELEKINTIEIDQTIYKIEMKLGGDLKNLGVLLGIVASNGTYACLWCNLKTPVVIANRYKIERTQAQALRKSATKELGYFNKPIFKFIEFKDVAIDMLHLHLRITDKLLSCLIDKIIVSDENDGIDLDERIALKKFESFLIVNCNITNPFVYDKEGIIKIRLRTLDAKERVIIFEKLFEDGKQGFIDIFANYNILEEHDFRVENFVWNEFRKIYNQIKALDKCEFSIESFDMVGLKENLSKWLYFYKKIDNMENTSPYVHAFVFHMPEFLERHGSINLYNCQGLEKLNDISTKLYHSSTNKNKTDKSFLVQLIKKMNRMEFFNVGQNYDDLFQFMQNLF